VSENGEGGREGKGGVSGAGKRMRNEWFGREGRTILEGGGGGRGGVSKIEEGRARGRV
jgi:hypothetical protein